MAKDIFSPYEEGTSPQKPRATNGGQCDPKPIPYSAPQGPTSHMQQGPGLHGMNHGNNVNQGKH